MRLPHLVLIGLVIVVAFLVWKHRSKIVSAVAK